MAKMSESEWKAFLVEKPRTGKLATVRKSGGPHVAPIWFDLDDDGTILFMTGIRTVKGHAIRRDPRVGLCVDDETPPFSFVVIDGEVTSITEDPDEMLPWSIRIAARYMGADRGDAYGRADGVTWAEVVLPEPRRQPDDDPRNRQDDQYPPTLARARQFSNDDPDGGCGGVGCGAPSPWHGEMG